jgi:hypothetical protein
MDCPSDCSLESELPNCQWIGKNMNYVYIYIYIYYIYIYVYIDIDMHAINDHSYCHIVVTCSH